MLDPWGKVLLDMGPDFIGIQYVDIDLNYLNTIRK